MSHIPQPLVDLAEGVLAQESGNSDDPKAVAGALERACVELHERLAPLISSVAFEALLARSVKLASRDFASLSAVTITRSTGSSFAGLPGAIAGRAREEAIEALTGILGHFFHLLVIFIGEDLGLRKVREAWPGVTYRGNSSARADR